MVNDLFSARWVWLVVGQEICEVFSSQSSTLADLDVCESLQPSETESLAAAEQEEEEEEEDCPSCLHRETREGHTSQPLSYGFVCTSRTV